MSFRRTGFVLLVGLLLSGAGVFGQPLDLSHRYLIRKGEQCDDARYGYVDGKGKVVIEARFKLAQEFSEGLAGVWDGKKWGFIDKSGQVVIQMQYDWVLPFADGIAEVSHLGRRQWIGTDGRIAFENPFDGRHPYSSDHDVGKAPDGSAAAINRLQRKVIRDSGYFHIRSFADGVTVMTGRLLKAADPVNGIPESRELAVIDQEGKVLIPFGQYDNLSDFHNGFATTYVFKESERLPLSVRVIDRTGKVMSEYPFPQWEVRPTDLVFSEGVATVHAYVSETLPDRLDVLRPTVVSRLSLVRPDGRIIRETSWETVTPFHEGRAFAKIADGPWMLIDTSAQPVGDKEWLGLPLHAYWDIRPSDFENGYAFGRLGNAFGWIDRQGNFTDAPLSLGANERFVNRCGDFAIIERAVPGKESRVGFWHRPSNTMVAPTFRSIEVCHKEGPLIKAATAGHEGYIDLNGAYVWKKRSCREKAKH